MCVSAGRVGLLHIQVTSQTPWSSAEYEVVLCVYLVGGVGGSFLAGHEPDSMGPSSVRGYVLCVVVSWWRVFLFLSCRS